MRGYVTVTLDGFDIVEHWCDYMVELGMSEAHVLGFCSSNVYERTIKTVKKFFPVARVGRLHPGCFSAEMREEILRRYHPEGTWAFFNDLDEFPRIHVEVLADLIESDGLPFVFGHWVDRVAHGGTLKPIESNGLRLDEQFPHRVNVRQDQGLPNPVYSYIAAPYVPNNHHPNKCNKTSGRVSAVETGKALHIEVDHYRWKAGLIERLEHRLPRAYDQLHAKSIQIELDYLRKHNGVNPEILS